MRMKTILLATGLLIVELLVMLMTVEQMKSNWELLQFSTKVIVLILANIGLILIGLNCWIGSREYLKYLERKVKEIKKGMKR